jgi:hypothetical protein
VVEPGPDRPAHVAKYANLLTAAMWPILAPQIQHNRKAIFRRPWIDPTTPPPPAGIADR